MIKLLLDSSDKDLNIGVAKDDQLIYSTSYYAWQRQSEYMIPEIEKAMKELNISLNQIDLIALGIGPGSYTGIRIPLTIAKTLNTSLGIKVCPLSSLKILGRSDESYIALINARSNRSYIGIYSNGKTLLEDTVIENKDIELLVKPYIEKGFVFRGDIAYLNLDISSESKVIEGLLTHSLISEYLEDSSALKPVYLKD